MTDLMTDLATPTASHFARSPTALIWIAADAPLQQGEIRGICRTCGSEGIGLPFTQWVKETFTDHDKLAPGEIVCHACLFCFDEASTAIQQRTGKEKEPRFRNYSHFVLNGQWFPLSKGGKRQMREILGQSPSVAVIAESGQKHLVFRARPGWWQFEEQQLPPCPDLLTDLLSHIEPLYNAGANKSEIETGRYTQKTLMKMLPVWYEHEPALRVFRGGLPLQLALFLAQKEATTDDT